MARIFPDPPLSCEPQQQTLYEAIRAVSDPALLAWMALPGSEGWCPDWMLIQENRLCYLLAVCPWIPETTDLAAAEKIVLGENGRMRQFLASCHVEKGSPIYGAVVFPTVLQDDLDELQKRLPQVDTALWGAEMVHPQAIGQILEETPALKPLPADVVSRLRRKLCPELTIPASLVANPRNGPRAGPGPRLTSHLLNLDQEFLSKQALLSSPTPRNEVSAEKIQIVTGAAGSGKSLVLLYRAALQERLRPDARILAITHNKPLCHEMQRRLRTIHPATRVQWQTFFHFCGTFHQRSRKILGDVEKDAFLAGARAELGELATLPPYFVHDEIDWIREQGFEHPEIYLEASRNGRKRPLNQKQRGEFLILLALYREHLEAEDLTDWSGVVENTWRKVCEGRVAVPVFDLIFIDEAQFFAPIWFQLIWRCLEPERGRLFLATDPTQGFLKRQNSLRAAGLDQESSRTQLRKVYRNSRAILEFAHAFYRRRLPHDDEDVQLADLSSADDLPQGEAPLFIEVKPFEDELSLVIYEILAALDEGASPAHFLVILHQQSVKWFVEKLNRLHGTTVAVDAKDVSVQESTGVRVTTLNATTGLESAIVFLSGLDAMFAPETQLDEADREERHRDQTRQIYMALTRASHRLCITYRLPQTLAALRGEGAPPH